MALSTPYCTLQDLADELKNNDAVDGDATVVTRHEDAINRASRMAEEWCHRDWTFHDYSSTALVPEEAWIQGDSLWLPWPIKTITEVKIENDVQDTDDYKFRVGKSEVRFVDEWPSPIAFDDADYVSIKGTFGYTHDDLTTVPNDTTFPEGVRRAVVLIAATISGDYRKEVMGREGGVEQLLITDIPKEAKMLLRKYRRRFF